MTTVNSYYYICILLLVICAVITESHFPNDSHNRSVAVVIGTRPDVIKLAILINDLKFRWQEQLDVIIINTGQHKTMLNPMLETFNIHPTVTLDLLTSGSTIDVNHNTTTTINKNQRQSTNGLSHFVSKAMNELEYALLNLSNQPDMLIVQGDTNTALIGGMLSFYSQIPLVHVEAGLRTWETHIAPYPEEFNRRVLGIVCKLCLAPTILAKNALIKDGTSIDNIHVVGNTVIDALRYILERPLEVKYRRELGQLVNRFGIRIDHSPALLVQRRSTKRLAWHVPGSTADTSFNNSNASGLVNVKYVLVSTHRRENQAEGIQQIMKAVGRLAELYSGSDMGKGKGKRERVIFLVLSHLNPVVLRKITNSEVPLVSFDFLDDTCLNGDQKGEGEGEGEGEGDDQGVSKDCNSGFASDVADKTAPLVVLLPPVKYAPFAHLLRGASAVITDSGGLQEESAALGVPCLVLR